MSSQALLSSDTELLLMLQATETAPSPHGISKRKEAQACGRRAQLREAKEALRVLAGEPEPTYDTDGMSSAKVGSYFHLLMEARLKRRLGAELVYDARAGGFNQNFLEAIRLYQGFHATFGSIEECLGCEVVGAEVDLGRDQDAVTERLGGKLTGRADAIVNILDPAVALANIGLGLPAGRAILDWKSGKAHGGTASNGANRDHMKYVVADLQAPAYLWLDAFDGNAPGSMVFFRMARHKVLERKSFAFYVRYPQAEDEAVLRAFVASAEGSKARGECNASACYNETFGDWCPYFGKECQRF